MQIGIALAAADDPHAAGSQAVRWLRAAAEAGSTEAMVRLGSYMVDDRDTFAEGEAWLRQAAEAGDPEGKLQFGRLLLLTQRDQEAEEWLSAVFDANPARVLDLIAGLQLMGATTLARAWQSRADTPEWLARASAEGNVSPTAELILRLAGQHELAATQPLPHPTVAGGVEETLGASGLPDPGLLLGMAQSESGDLEQAKETFQAAARAGDSRAAHKLAVIYDDEGNVERAMAWYERAAGEGEVSSMYNLGLLFTDRDPAASERWLRAASAHGYPSAPHALALTALREGRTDDAIDWLGQGVARGHKKSIALLAELRSTPAQRPPQRRWWRRSIRRRRQTVAAESTVSIAPTGTAAELERLRGLVREEEAERLLPMVEDSASRRRAADAFADLVDLFAIAQLAEDHYHQGRLERGELDMAIRAIDRLRENHRWSELAPDRRVILNIQAALCVRARYEIAAGATDLEHAVALAQEAENLARQNDPSLIAPVLESLGYHLTAAFEAHAERRELIDRAVAALRESIARVVPGRPTCHVLCLLSAALLLRGKVFGSSEDVDEAASVLEPLPSQDPERAQALYHLGTVLIYRAEQSNDSDNLGRAIAALEEAVDRASESARPWYESNLAVALEARFKAKGTQEDHSRAVQLTIRALNVIPEGTPDRLSIVQNANARAAADGSDRDSVARARALVEATPLGARARAARLGALAGSLSDAFIDTLDRHQLAEAVAACEQALEVADIGSVDRPSILGGLARALTLSYALEGDDGALDRAIATASDADKSAPDASPERAGFAFTAASAWSLRAAKSACSQDAVRTTSAFRRAVELGDDRATGVALRAGTAWGGWAAEERQWPEAAMAFRRALGAADELYRRQLARADREAWLRHFPGLPADAALACVHAAESEEAVLSLERGRARLLSEVLERDRARLDELRGGDFAALADSFSAAAVRLTALEGSELRG